MCIRDSISTAYVKADFETPGITYTFMEEDFIFAPGIRVIIRQGHTPAVASLLVEGDVYKRQGESRRGSRCRHRAE